MKRVPQLCRPAASITLLLVVVSWLGVGTMAAPISFAQDFHWQMRSQQAADDGNTSYQRVMREETWAPATTAFIVCDVWDKHHCLNAVRRLEEFAPRLNQVLKEARRRGAIIIHSPSDCMPAYETHPARARALSVPPAADQPQDIQHWCSRIPTEEQAAYPIDQSDGGEDDDPVEHAAWAAELVALGRNPGMPWKAQSPLIEIDSDRDYISDRGDEVWNILEQRSITHVVLTGVHTNMCVLGRPFGLRQMVRNGKNTVLMRDMTDCMYNPKRWPYVDHFTGNDLVISHVERFVCPTVTSDQLLGGQPFVSKTDRRAKRDVTAVETATGSGADDLPDSDWKVVRLPSQWSKVIGQRHTELPTTVWYRSTVRLPDRFLQNHQLLVRVTPASQENVTLWLNGTPLTAMAPSARTSAAEAGKTSFSVPSEAIVRNDANLLVLRVQAKSLPASPLSPPTLIAGDRALELFGRWQFRFGDDAAWSNMPLPAKFGTATDVVFEPVAD